MRKIFVLRGPACSGKTSFIIKHRLEPFTISLDAFYPSIRELDVCGRWVDVNLEKRLRNTLVEEIQDRMNRGETIFIDGRNLKLKDIYFYRNIADKNRYELGIINFTATLEQMLDWNSNKPEWGKMSKKEIIEEYNLMQSVVLPDKLPTEMRIRQTPVAEDFNQYDEVVHIGDVHGCIYPLLDALGCGKFGKGLKPNTAYVFTGDLLDKGPENVDTFQFFASISGLPNVYLIEGNHDTKLWNWAAGVNTDGDEEFQRTISELTLAGITKNAVKNLCKKMKTYLCYTFNGNVFFCTHGGVPRIPGDMVCVPANQLIKGVGSYENSNFVDNMFEKIYAGKNLYSIHGHRNNEHSPTNVNSRCFNLNGYVENYGAIRRLTVNKEGFYINTVELEDSFTYKEAV